MGGTLAGAAYAAPARVPPIYIIPIEEKDFQISFKISAIFSTGKSMFLLHQEENNVT